MERSSVLRLLPTTYAAAIILRDAGFDDGVIARELGVATDAVRHLLRVAQAKLDALECGERRDANEPARDQSLGRFLL